MIQLSYLGSSREMKSGFTATVQRQKKSCRNGGTAVTKIKKHNKFFFFFVLFGVKVTVHHVFVPPGSTVNSDFYFNVFDALERRCASRKTGTVAQRQLAAAS